VAGLVSIGEALRTAREEQGASIDDAAVATRIRPGQLEALEDEQFATLGGTVYAKGFLRQYAAYLGLDPAPLLEAYRTSQGDQAAPPVLSGGLRPIEAGFGGFGGRRRSRGLVVGSVLAGIVLLIGLVSLFSARGGRDVPRVASPVTSVRADTASRSAGAPATTRPKPRPAAVPAGKVQVVMAWTGPSWTSVTLDGKLEFQGTLEPGERRTWTADERIDLRLGNAGAVTLRVNGRALGPAGAAGQVWRGAFTPKGPVQG
jgi:cytoskeletal protein RodZ